MLREVAATRYVLPLREGGSLPGLVEADDLGMYVVKFLGAGQGRKTLVAELISGEIGRRLGLPVPELVLVEFDAVIGRGEPDQEVQDLLKASGGVNLGMDYLPGALGFDPLAFDLDAEFAGRVLWFDAYVTNVDRTWRNPNMLVWHARPFLIDHGASLIFHHNWRGAQAAVRRAYDASGHVLLPVWPDVRAADAELSPRVTADMVDEVVALVPDEWLVGEPGFASAREVREAYSRYLVARAADRSWLPEVSG